MARGQEDALGRLLSLRLHQKDGRRSPHKPLLALLAIGRLLETGESALPWSVAEEQLATLIEEFGPASKTGRAQAAAYPFTRLRSDGVWDINADVPMDDVGPLRESNPVGRFSEEIEQGLKRDPRRALEIARSLVVSHFPETLVADVLVASRLDPDAVLEGVAATAAEARRRSAAWRARIVEAWDRQCAFCGYDGLLRTATVGIEAAHVRWFSYGGPDDIDNGLALCSLHHKLFDRGALGLDISLRIVVSSTYTARTGAGRAVYELHGIPLSPRRGTQPPARQHISWHLEQVFKGADLAA